MLDSLAVSQSLYVEQMYLCICYCSEQNVQNLVNIGEVIWWVFMFISLVSGCLNRELNSYDRQKLSLELCYDSCQP